MDKGTLIMVTLIQVDKGTLITVTFLCDDVITQSDTCKQINYAVIINYNIKAKIDKLVTLLAASQQTIANLQDQVGTLSAAARPEEQEPITVDREWLFSRSYTQKVNTPKME